MTLLVAIVTSLIAGAVLDHLFFVDEEALINKGKAEAYMEIDKLKAMRHKL